jgi:NAD dependent epimerase/dehydratase
MPLNGWAGKQVLVTGAGGFIGSHLVECLVEAGARVRAFVRYTSSGTIGNLADCSSETLAEVEIFRGDLTNPEAVARGISGCEVVLNLGALIPIPYSYVHPREYIAANVEGAINVLEACRREEVSRLVQISSSEVYGTAQTVPIDELHPLQAQSPYAATKIGADQLALSYWRSFGLPVVVARPFNTFGPRQSARAVIPTIITQALVREVVELGSTRPLRDFLYVRDTAGGIMACAAAPDAVLGEVVNLGTGVEVSVGDVVDRVLAIVGRSVPVLTADERVRPEASEVERLLCDAGKAERLLGWRHETSFDDGLRATVDWMRGAIDAYGVSAYTV